MSSMHSEFQAFVATVFRACLRLPAVSGVTIAFLAALVCSPVAAEDYKFGPMDKLNIRVVDWQPSDGTFRQWTALTGEFTIGPDGTLSLPFAGEVKAQGRSAHEVATDLSHALQEKLGLVEPPATSVEISEFRPIFVAGEVQTPGKFPFDPEMTVLKAISLAGGMRRSLSSDQRFERDLLSAKGNYDLLLTERERLLVQQARLEAELRNDADFEFADSSDEGDHPGQQDMVADEKALMLSRQQGLSAQRSALEERKVLLEDEVSTLTKNKEAQSRQMDLIKLEIARTGKLADQGLILSSRILSLELTASDTQSKLLDLDTATVRSKQEIGRVSAELVELGNKQKTDVIAELQKTKAAIKANDLNLKMYAGLMTEALTNAPAAAGLAGTRSEDLLKYTVMRTTNGTTEEISALESTALRPGDLVKVSLIER
ncbi:polysaccharide biosynthesis/export family protein [Sinorhizobium sp. BG8]|uniref:polysaccharide biosynthesis/export family protein n=1 Tax=Sinorhizobium sp. BG8 TaxID=2613773 RepID=UPI00193DEA2B|nr:polysaccharide biosynthesis/export family protein [Sinorhizobium sp. BG8]QRM53580.1 sugar ABC transporter substrate-binding protein [Sinorhizobium sp. BG8]